MDIAKKYQWIIIAATILFASAVAFWLYSSGGKNHPGILFSATFILITMPGFLKFFITLNYQPAEGNVVASRDLSKVVLNSKGGASCNYLYEADVKYSINGRNYSCTVKRSNGPFHDKITIYYNPENPFYYTIGKKLSISGWGFFAAMGFIVCLQALIK